MADRPEFARPFLNSSVLIHRSHLDNWGRYVQRNLKTRVGRARASLILTAEHITTVDFLLFLVMVLFVSVSAISGKTISAMVGASFYVVLSMASSRLHKKVGVRVLSDLLKDWHVYYEHTAGEPPRIKHEVN